MLRRRVPGFRPSANAFRFANDFAPAPVLSVPVPLVGAIPIGNAAGGMCGGMVFAVLDLLQHGLPPPPHTDAPTPDTPLFRYLASRLLASFNGIRGVCKYLEWMRYPDRAEWSSVHRSIAWHTVHDEWPAIRADLDNGQPCPLGLIKVASHNPFAVGRNHQVLAYGYDLDEDSGDLSVLVYDPNFPGDDDVRLSLNLADPENPSPITYSADEAGRGFFRTVYTAADPSGVLHHG